MTNSADPDQLALFYLHHFFFFLHFISSPEELMLSPSRWHWHLSVLIVLAQCLTLKAPITTIVVCFVFCRLL